MRLRYLAALLAAAVVGTGATVATTATRPVTRHPVQTIYVRNTSSLSDKVVTNALPAFQAALDKDFAPYWKTTATLRFVKSESQIPRHGSVIYVQNTLDVQGALAYHGIADGVPFARIGVGVSLAYGFDWTVGFTHEQWEMLADPSIIRTAQSPDGRIWALENADPVESEQFAYNRPGADGKPVRISDFITDAWFGGQTLQPYDFTHSITQPLQILTGGYAQVWDGLSWNVLLGAHTRAQHAWIVSEKGERGG